MKFEIKDTRTVPTIKVVTSMDSFYLHSHYDPLKEAKIWGNGVSSTVSDLEIISVIGMGAGHHIRELLKNYRNVKVVVVEISELYYNWIKNSHLIDDLLANERVEYISFKRNGILFKQYIDENLLIYQPALRLGEKKYPELINEIRNFSMQKRTLIDQLAILHENFQQNILLGDQSINNHMIRKPVLLISAGPSLTKQLPLLKSVFLAKTHIIACVGTALKPLLRFDIIPDFVMVSDPKEAIREQIVDGISRIDVPLFYLSTANNIAVKNYKGPRFIVWQHGFSLAEDEANKRSEKLIHTGGSVATCLLDLVVQLGASKIALVGQDLAFTNNMSHAENAHRLKVVEVNSFSLRVTAYNQKGQIHTSRNLSIYLKWFSDYVKDKKMLRFWNCTEGGAYIEGWLHRPLIEFIQKNEKIVEC